MENYRKKKSELLEKKYNMLVNRLIEEHGSIDRVPQTGNQALENKTDQMILEKIIFNKTFAILPFMCDDTYLHSVYTIGCWYYWRTPEIIIHFKENVELDSELIHVIINTIHTKLYDLEKKKTDVGPNHTFEKKLNLTIDNYDITFLLTLVEPDNLIDVHSPYMLWFYTFWDNVQPDANGEASTIYPLYLIEIDRETIDHIKNTIINRWLDRFETELGAKDSNDNISDDFVLSSDDDNDNDGNMDTKSIS